MEELTPKKEAKAKKEPAPKKEKAAHAIAKKEPAPKKIAPTRGSTPQMQYLTYQTTAKHYCTIMPWQVFPTKETFLSAVRAGNYLTWPGLTTAPITKYLPNLDKTQVKEPAVKAKKETMKKAPIMKKAPNKGMSEAAAPLPAVVPAVEAMVLNLQ